MLNIEFTNSPPKVEDLPQLDLKLFAKSIVAAVHKYKEKEEDAQCQTVKSS